MFPQILLFVIVAMLLLLVSIVEGSFKKCFWCRKTFLIDMTKIHSDGFWYHSIDCPKCGWCNRLYVKRF